MGLNWQHTIWNETFKRPTDKLVFIFLADNCSDSKSDYEFYLDDVADYVGISRRHVARILAEYSEIVSYDAGLGRSQKSKIKWIVGQKKRAVKVDIKVDIKGDIKQDIKVDTPPHTPHKEYIYTTQTTQTTSDSDESHETVWDELSAVMIRQGILPTKSRKMIGGLIKEFGLTTVAETFSEVKDKLGTTADAFAYFKACVSRHKPKPVEVVAVGLHTAPPRKKPYWNPTEKGWFIPHPHPGLAGIRDSRFVGQDGKTLEQSLIDNFGMTLEEIRNAQSASARN